MKKLLHIGSGGQHILGTHGFESGEWEEIRLDIEPAVPPDIIGSMTDMGEVEDGSIDAIFSSHNIEHLVPHELPVALKEFLRVLSDDGYLVVTCPDLQSVCALVAQDKLDEAAYHTGAGIPIAPMDILYGWRPAMAHGQPFMAHRMGFTQKVLSKSLQQAGFSSIAVMRGNDYALYAVATKKQADDTKLRALFDLHWRNKPQEEQKDKQASCEIVPPANKCSSTLSLERLYLDTLKKSLLNEFYLENHVRSLYIAVQIACGRPLDHEILADPAHKLSPYMKHVQDKIIAGDPWWIVGVENNGKRNILNLKDLTPSPYIFSGKKRINHLEQCLDIIRNENISGDLLEVGVRSGGEAIFMQGYLRAWNMQERIIWANDEFDHPDKIDQLMSNFAKFSLLDQNIHFLNGLQQIQADKISLLSLIHITISNNKDIFDILDKVYGKLVSGGFIIIDNAKTDFAFEISLDDYKAKNKIDEQIAKFDSLRVFWRKA